MMERRQRRPQPQDLQQLAGGAVSGDDTLTETVGKKRGFRSIARRKAGHDSYTQCNDKTNTPILKNGRKSLSDLHSRALGTLSARMPFTSLSPPRENCKPGLDSDS